MEWAEVIVEQIKSTEAAIRGRALTRREQFAMAAMQGDLASKPRETNETLYTLLKYRTAAWVACADALIAELEKDGKP